MKKGEFIVNGKSSLDFNTFIQHRPIIEAPIRKIDRRESIGIDGYVMVDGGHYKDSNLKLMLYTMDGDRKAYDVRSEIYSLFNTGDYVKVRFYFDPNKNYYVALSEEAVRFENKYYFEESQTWELPLSVYPWKEITDVEPIEIESSATIRNEYQDPSLPLIYVLSTEANKRIRITINGKKFDLNTVSTTSGTYIDSDMMDVYRKSGNVYYSENINYVAKGFPVLKPGRNDISVTGPVSKVVIDPRWRVLV